MSAGCQVNWLIRKICTVYVEIFRNIPPLLVILFWYQGVLALLPGVRDSYSLPLSSYLNVRGLYSQGPYGVTALADCCGPRALHCVELDVARRAKARQMATGQQFPVFLTSLALIVGLPLLAFVVSGFR